MLTGVTAVRKTSAVEIRLSEIEVWYLGIVLELTGT